jgi:hypothetical protein
MKKLICILLAMMPVFISCVKRDWTNPFSSDCPKEIWTPTNFAAVQEGTTVKLTWSQPINNISGFKIQKSVEGSAAGAIQDQAKGATQLTDNSLIGGKMHLYSLTAFAGSNTSNTVTAQITPVLTAGITTTAVSAVGAATARRSRDYGTGCLLGYDAESHDRRNENIRWNRNGKFCQFNDRIISGNYLLFKGLCHQQCGNGLRE